MVCGEFSSHRVKHYVTNQPSETCVRCGKQHADVGRLDEQAESLDPHVVKILVDSAWACGYQAGRDATDDQRQIKINREFKSGQPCDTCGGTGWIDPELASPAAPQEQK